MCASPARAKTLVVEGKLDGTVTVKKNVTFSVDQTLSQFTYQFSVPSIYNSAGNVQRLDDYQVSATPQPTEAKETTDKYGNRSRKLIWRNLQSDAHVSISYTTGITATISPRSSRAPFPLKTVPESERGFLQKSKLVQSEAPQVIELAHELTAGVATEHQAVSAILTHVADAIKYQYNPKTYDALYGLTTGTGNCQNFAHLAVALLRASGVPARVSIGQTLKDKWKIPLDKRGSSLVQGMGEGLHAWIEVWYPDLGWMPCDPQQSRLFTSTRHIKFGHGLDAADVLEYWSGAPVVPRMSDSFEALYSKDSVDLRLREALDKPTTYLLAGPVASITVAQDAPPIIQAKPVPLPLPPTPKPAPVKPKPKPIEPTIIAQNPPPTIQPKPVPLPLPPTPKPAPVKPKPELPKPITVAQDTAPIIPPKPVPLPLQSPPKPAPVKPKPEPIKPITIAQDAPPKIQPKPDPLPLPPTPKPTPVKPKAEPPKPITVAQDAPPIIQPKPVPLPPSKPKPVPAKPKPGTPVEIGNRDFPSMVETYIVDGNVGHPSFDRETAEYATSKHLFAQAFTIDAPFALKDVSLAMRKFGGDGTIYIDVVRDEGGKPSLDGVRSMPVSLEKITKKPGYYWVDFSLPESTNLVPGKYWVVLRHSGEAIMNWFYTPGKRVNGPDDSRSTAKGWQWEDVLAGEFVYRVRGAML
jgi:transglutaminase-like putative cysteine protease